MSKNQNMDNKNKIKNNTLSSDIQSDDAISSKDLSTSSSQKSGKFLGRFLLTFFLTLILLLVGSYFFLFLAFKGPSTYMRNKWVTTCNESSTTSFIPKLILSDKEITNIVSQNKISYSSTTTTPAQVESDEEGLE